MENNIIKVSLLHLLSLKSDLCSSLKTKHVGTQLYIYDASKNDSDYYAEIEKHILFQLTVLVLFYVHDIKPRFHLHIA